MRFRASRVSASAEGDYYQAAFEADAIAGDDGPIYLVIQRQFEFPDGGRCYVETHDARYTGHFRLRRMNFTADAITIEIAQSGDNVVEVTFPRLSTSEFREVSRLLRIIGGDEDPEIALPPPA